MRKLRIAVFVSGNGTNLQSIIDAIETGKLDAEIRLVLSNNSHAYGLTRANKRGIPTAIVNSGDFKKRDEFVDRMLDELKNHCVDFIVLAGYLRKIPPEIIDRYGGRIINIHPGPLPDFGGKGMFGVAVHKAVLKGGLKETCVTIHHVTKGYDEGAIIATSPVEIMEGDTPEILQKRVLEVEHKFYPEIIQRFANGEI